MNGIGRMYPNLSASELSNMILKGKGKSNTQTPAVFSFFSWSRWYLRNLFSTIWFSCDSLQEKKSYFIQDHFFFCSMKCATDLSKRREGLFPTINITWDSSRHDLAKKTMKYKVIRLLLLPLDKCNYNSSKRATRLRWKIIILRKVMLLWL